MIRKYNFYDIFTELPNGHLSPKRVIKINEVTIGPGVTFGPGAVFGGFDLHRIKGRDIAAEEDGQILNIKGYFGIPV